MDEYNTIILYLKTFITCFIEVKFILTFFKHSVEFEIPTYEKI